MGDLMKLEQVGRRSLAAAGFVAATLGFSLILAALVNQNWSEFDRKEGYGHFGLWTYKFQVNDVSKSGDIQGLSPSTSVLCEYNKTLSRYRLGGYSKHPWNPDESITPARNDCDEMIDAVGLAKNLGCLSGLF